MSRPTPIFLKVWCCVCFRIHFSMSQVDSRILAHPVNSPSSSQMITSIAIFRRNHESLPSACACAARFRKASTSFSFQPSWLMPLKMMECKIEFEFMSLNKYRRSSRWTYILWYNTTTNGRPRYEAESRGEFSGPTSLTRASVMMTKHCFCFRKMYSR